MKGLVLDSHAQRVEVIRSAMGSDGHEVIPVEQSTDIGSVVEEIQPEFIFIQDKHPKISCEEACVEIKRTRRLNLIPLIVLTEDDSDRDRTLMRLFSAGADDVVFNIPGKKELIQIFRNAIEEKTSVQKVEWVGNWFEFDITNQLQYIQTTNTFIEKLFLKTGLPEQDIFNLTYALRELMHNAYEHGNLKDTNKKVRVSHVLFEDRLIIKIEDEGEGFNHRIVEDPLKDPVQFFLKRKKSGKRIGGLGIATTRKLMDEIRYNQKGNIVLLTKNLPRKNETQKI